MICYTVEGLIMLILGLLFEEKARKHYIHRSLITNKHAIAESFTQLCHSSKARRLDYVTCWPKTTCGELKICHDGTGQHI